MKKMQKKILIAVIGVCILGVIFYNTVWTNVNFLFAIAEGLDKPSTLYYYVTEKIYRLSEKKDIGKEILENLAKDKNKHLHGLYIQVLGVIGESNATIFLIKCYADYQSDKKQQSTLNSIIDSLGAIGNTEAVPLLERLMTNYDRLDVQVTKYSIVRSLFLLTVRTYNYVDDTGKEATLNLTDDLINARKVIEASQGRSRTFEEMMTIDRVYRPPDWKEK